MRCACIDIGTNTTRLLVAEPGPDGLREVLAQRVFTRIGRALDEAGAISAPKLEEVAEVVAAQARAARALGADSLDAVATAAIRAAPNRAELVAAVSAAADLELTVLTGEEEARFAFAGATRALAEPPSGPVGVVDVGGGSTELAVGTLDEGVTWIASLEIGSGGLADRHLRSDPPAGEELGALRAEAAEAFAGIAAPHPNLAVAVGGSATSLGRLVGPCLDAPALRDALDLIVSAPAAEVARRHDLDAERVRLLPGGLAVLEEAVRAFGVPLQVAGGGLREGVIHRRLAEAG
ncbi:MAG TPA: hypothetical protein VIL64_01160 [Solirubrobacteraceae bacterium]|jgi:exopolyphosphatase/guanosine-5'-triphosphate,3'-diphosphate pyrophosphatase